MLEKYFTEILNVVDIGIRIFILWNTVSMSWSYSLPSFVSECIFHVFMETSGIRWVE